MCVWETGLAKNVCPIAMSPHHHVLAWFDRKHLLDVYCRLLFGWSLFANPVPNIGLAFRKCKGLYNLSTKRITQRKNR